MDNKFYVYVWIEESSGKVFYVGKGSGDRYKRVSRHARSKDFLSIYDSFPCHPLIVSSYMSDDDACKLEMDIIAQIRTDPCNILTNKTKGGESSVKSVPASEEYRRRVSEMVRGENNPNYGHHWTQEMKDALSKKRRESGIYVGAKNPRAKSVKCVETGETFPTMTDAANSINRSQSDITHAIKTGGKAGPYHWVFI